MFVGLHPDPETSFVRDHQKAGTLPSRPFAMGPRQEPRRPDLVHGHRGIPQSDLVHGHRGTPPTEECHRGIRLGVRTGFGEQDSLGIGGRRLDARSVG